MKKKLVFLMALVIVSFVTFSSATYAWFSKQYNPKVDNLNFNLSTQENMMISTTGAKGSFKDDISFAELVNGNVTLKPLKGVVSENSISVLDGDVIATNSNYIKFSLYFSSSNDMNVYLQGSTTGTVIDIVRNDLSIFTDEQINKMVDSIRIGFLTYSTSEIPTSSGIEINYSPLFTNVYAMNSKSDVSYKSGIMPYETFNNIGHTGGILNDVSLLNAEANKINKMDVFIWLEQEDVNCNESIFNTELKINLRFLAVKNEEADEQG